MVDFWQNALLLMDKKKVKPADLARLTGKHKSSVSDWINSGVLPRVDDAAKIAGLLGVSVEYLMTGVDDNALAPREKELLQLCSILNDEKFKAVLDVAQIMNNIAKSESSGGSSSAGSDKGAVNEK